MKTLVKWTISDYHKMIESDILIGRNCELIEGEIIEMSPELPQHYNTVKRSVNYLATLLILFPLIKPVLSSSKRSNIL